MQRAVLAYLVTVRGFTLWQPRKVGRGKLARWLAPPPPRPGDGLVYRVNSQGVPLHAGTGAITGYRPSRAAGVSDLAGILPGGRAFFLEVKRPGEGPTPLQRDFLAAAHAAGALVAVVHSIEETAAALARTLPGTTDRIR